MKALLKLFVTLILAFAGMSVSSAQSLAERTGERVELYTALSVVAGHPLTKAEYRLAAAELAAKVGLSYDQSATGNIAILHASPLAGLTIGVETSIEKVSEGSLALNDSRPTVLVRNTEAERQWQAMEATKSLELGYTVDSVVVLMDGKTVLSAPRQIIYIGEPRQAKKADTVVIETVVEVPTDFCPCGEFESVASIQRSYLAYRELIRKETDSYEKRKLIACRIKLGEIARSNWRYGAGFEDANKPVSSSKPRAALMSNKSISHGGQTPSRGLKSTKAGKKKSLFACAKAAKHAR